MIRTSLIAFVAGVAAAFAVGLGAAAALSLTPADRFDGSSIGLGPLELLSVAAEGESTVATLAPGAFVVVLLCGIANAVASIWLAGRRQATSTPT